MNELLLQLYARHGLDPTPANEAALRAALAAEKTATRAGLMLPKTVDAEARSIEAVIATEDPAEVWDYERWEPVDEILLMKGARLSRVRKGKLPLLDAHQRDTSRRVLGSVVDIHVAGPELIGTEVYSALSEPEFVKCSEGHLDQRSVGYRVYATTRIEPGESATVEGRPFAARAGRALHVVTDWMPVESSVVPIGADPACGTRAAIVEPPPKEHKETVPAMDKKLRALLVSFGMPEKATEDEARAYLVLPETQAKLAERAVSSPPLSAAPPLTPPVTRAEFETLQTLLVSRVNADERASVFRPYAGREGVAELQAKANSENWTPEACRKAILDLPSFQTPPTGGLRITADEADKRRDCAILAISARANPGMKLDPKDADKARQFRGMTMVDLARHCVEAAGISTRAMDAMDIVGRAFTSTSDYPHILSSTAHKQLLAAYGMAPMQWTKWCKRGSLSDFKATPRVQMSASGTLPQTPEGAEFAQYSVTDTQEDITLKTFGKIFAITRQAIINDDLNAFSAIPTQHARAWARTINQEAVKVILANAALHDGTTLYYATVHANKSTMTAATTKDTASAIVRVLYGLIQAQKDADGTSYLQIAPRYILTTPTKAQHYIQAIYEQNLAASNATVDIRRMGLDVLVEPELENSLLTGYATTLAFMFADPMDAPTVEVAFLNGNDAPALEVDPSFTVDGIKYKVRGDVAAKAIDYRGTAMHVA